MMTSQLAEAVRLFNAGEYFAFHEVVEELWKPLPEGSEKTFWQGWLQLGVGLYHWQRGNAHGTRVKLRAGLDKLDAALADPRFHQPLDLTVLTAFIRPLLADVELSEVGNSALPPFPAVNIPSLAFEP